MTRMPSDKPERPFRQRVIDAVARIPRGRTMTYKEVAETAGHPGAYRAVGSVLKANHDPSVPCHRVIRSDGAIGEYNRGARRKRELLDEEGAL